MKLKKSLLSLKKAIRLKRKEIIQIEYLNHFYLFAVSESKGGLISLQPLESEEKIKDLDATFFNSEFRLLIN